SSRGRSSLTASPPPPEQFVDDSALEEAVRSELVSEPQIPCYSGKIQGISSTFASVTRICSRNDYYNQCLTSKFPAHRNRELIGPLNRHIREVLKFSSFEGFEVFESFRQSRKSHR